MRSHSVITQERRSLLKWNFLTESLSANVNGQKQKSVIKTGTKENGLLRIFSNHL